MTCGVAIGFYVKLSKLASFDRDRLGGYNDIDDA